MLRKREMEGHCCNHITSDKTGKLKGKEINVITHAICCMLEREDLISQLCKPTNQANSTRLAG